MLFVFCSFVPFFSLLRAWVGGISPDIIQPTSRVLFVEVRWTAVYICALIRVRRPYFVLSCSFDTAVDTRPMESDRWQWWLGGGKEGQYNLYSMLHLRKISWHLYLFKKKKAARIYILQAQFWSGHPLIFFELNCWWAMGFYVMIDNWRNVSMLVWL